MADIQAIAQQRDNSMMTWEGTQLMGTQAIIEKINSLPFESVQHRVSMIDAQPSSATVASLIVLVTGHLVVDGNVDAPMPYSQMFQSIDCADATGISGQKEKSDGARPRGDEERKSALEGRGAERKS
ncbi:hypothetical protein QFC20_005660 [Naganishia adeliensis]|uniref:Uncharacterized protein n=1 Tax=Naganishia adeliensis TaxID=92952 RepID=A0ACC2VJK2_9TREE|nr:hypothetical protein QFC20_005660 [Naganishia adeliensis]